MESYIYALVDPRTGIPRYVGQTILGLEKRRKTHISNSKRAATTSRPKTPRDLWIKKLLSEGLEPEIKLIESGEWSTLDRDAKECAWILTYRILFFGHMLNLHDGGNPGLDALNGWNWDSYWTPERKKNHSDIMKTWAKNRRRLGLSVSPSVQTRMGNIESWADPERRAARVETCTRAQRKWHEEATEEMLEHKFKTIKSPEHAEKQRQNQLKRYADPDERKKTGDAVRAAMTDEVRQKMSDAKTKHYYGPRPCAGCGQSFSPTKRQKHDKKTCSNECRQLVAARSRSETRKKKSNA